MSRNHLATAIFAVGFLLTGYAVGNYLAPPGAPQQQVLSVDQLIPPQVPVPALDPYEGAMPRAQFERPSDPRGPLGAANSPETADSILAILADPDPILRASRLAAHLDAAGPEGIAEVREVLIDHSVNHDGISITLLLAYWSRHDPSNASWFAIRMVPEGYKTTAILTAVEAYARVDPEGASLQVGANAMASTANRAMLETALIRGWFESEKPGIEEYIRAQGEGEQIQRALSEFVRLAVERDGPEAVARWLENLPPDNKAFKLAAFRQGARAMAVVDPAAGVAFCEAHCDGPYGADMRGLVARRWAAQDGRAAMAWLATSPPGIERDRAVVKAFGGWRSSSDRTGLNAWIDENGPEDIPAWLEPALDNIAKSQANRDPEKAMKWAAAIDDEDTRAGAMIRVARAWRRYDEEAAEAWLAQSPLSEENREVARTAPRRPEHSGVPIHRSDPNPVAESD